MTERNTSVVRLDNLDILQAGETVESLLGDVPQSYPEYFELWGHKIPLEPLMKNILCGCERGNECIGLGILDMHHICVDLRNAAGGLHWDKGNGFPWVEFHTNFCSNVLNHCAEHFDWFIYGLKIGHYQRARLLLSGQQRANHEMDSPLFRSHISFRIPSGFFKVMMDQSTRDKFADAHGMTDEEAMTELERLAAWATADAIVSRITTSIRHELTGKYRGGEIVRLWPGELKRVVETAEKKKMNPYNLLPVIVDNEVRGLVPADVKRERKLLKMSPLIEIGSGVRLKHLIAASKALPEVTEVTE